LWSRAFTLYLFRADEHGGYFTTYGRFRFFGLRRGISFDRLSRRLADFLDNCLFARVRLIF
jgi:hypothetical protein